MGRASDIPIEPPTGAGPGIVRAVEDRSYLGYIAAALASAVLGGFVFAVWIPMAMSGATGGGDRLAYMIQAHGWIQLQGWAGLFVAGMAIRLMPRFAGRKPVPKSVTAPLLVVLVIPLVLRITLQTWADGSMARGVAVAIGATTAAGALGVAVVLAVTLAKGKKVREPWRYFAWAGTAWWAIWAVLALAYIPLDDPAPGVLAFRDNDALLWIVMLGPVGNFIWGVQSRSVPVFYGRGTPPLKQLILPGLLYNAGIAVLTLSLAADDTNPTAAGLGLAGAGAALIWMPPLAGSIRGQAKRLRPRARPAARFLIAANLSAMAAGLLLVWSGADMLISDDPWASLQVRDAARHLFGVGTVTMLILGMARLVAPFFALERTESGVPMLLERLPFWLLVAAVLLRAAVPLLGDTLDYEPGRHTMALAGALAWLAIAIFAFSVARAVRAEPRTKRALEGVAANARARNAPRTTGSE